MKIISRHGKVEEFDYKKISKLLSSVVMIKGDKVEIDGKMYEYNTFEVPHSDYITVKNDRVHYIATLTNGNDTLVYYRLWGFFNWKKTTDKKVLKYSKKVLDILTK